MKKFFAILAASGALLVAVGGCGRTRGTGTRCRLCELGLPEEPSSGRTVGLTRTLARGRRTVGLARTLAGSRCGSMGQGCKQWLRRYCQLGIVLSVVAGQAAWSTSSTIPYNSGTKLA